MAKILIVEDDPHTSALLAKLLGTKGYRTRIEANGAAALLAAHEDLPDMIIMDLRMPILDGEEAIHALRQNARTENIPVLVLSAHDDDRTVANALIAGAHAYLVKPPDWQELFSVVERLLTLRARE